MPLQSFRFQNTETTTPGDRNWRLFDDNSKTIVYTPTLSNPVGTVTVKPSFFVLYGPIVFFSITMIVAASGGWNANSTLTLPFNLLQPVGGVPRATSTAPVVIGPSGTLLAWAEVATGVAPSVLNLNTAHTNPSAVLTETVNINGWYIRD